MREVMSFVLACLLTVSAGIPGCPVTAGSAQVESADSAFAHVFGEYVADGKVYWQECTLCGEKSQTTPYVPGDVNGDGKVNMKDWTLLYNHISEVNTLDELQLLRGDVTLDSKVNMKDWSQLYDYISEADVPDGPTVTPEKDPEEIFTKTVHDFEGYQVAQLGSREDTDFVVYAEGVQEISSTASSNILQSLDENTMTYTFTNADATMKALKPGDVFFIPASEYHAEGATAKVKSIHVSGNTVTIQSDKVTMEDLFVYIDLDMYLNTDKAFYDESQLGEDMFIEIQKVTNPGAGARSLPEYDEDKYYSEITFGRTFSAGIGAGGGTVNGTLGISGSIDRIHIKMRYSVKDVYFSYEYNCRVRLSSQLGVEIDGTVDTGDKGKIPLVNVPLTATPFKFKIDAVGILEAAGSVSGTWEINGEYDVGVKLTPEEGLKPYITPVNVDYGKKISVEGKVEVKLDLRIGIGIDAPDIGDLKDGNIMNAYVAITPGFQLAGKMSVPEVSEGEADSMHTCKRCIDGDAYFFTRLSVNLNIKLPNKTGYDFSVDKDLAFLECTLEWDEDGFHVGAQLAEYKNKILDFYCSYTSDDAYEFDWTVCPHQLWKTEVIVTREDGSPAPYAAVIAIHTNGWQEYEPADENGVAVLYLLEGKHTLRVVHEGQYGTAQIELDDEPVEERVQLKDQRKLYIMIDLDVDTLGAVFYETLERGIKAKYPNAVYLTPAEYGNYLHNSCEIVNIAEFYENDHRFFEGDMILQFNSNGWWNSVDVTCATCHEWLSESKGVVWGHVEEIGTLALNVTYNIEAETDANDNSYITESYYEVEKAWYLFKYKAYADEFMYNNPDAVECVFSAHVNWQDLAPGVGWPITEGWWLTLSPAIARDYLMYTEQLFPYIDLWMSGNWNEGVENIAPVQ